MTPDLRFKTTSRLVLSAAVAVLVAFGMTQGRDVKLDAHQLDSVLPSVGSGHVESAKNGTAHTKGTSRVSTNGFRFAKTKNFYAPVAAQLLEPLETCEVRVAQGGWGYYQNVPQSWKVTFGGSAAIDRNGDPRGQELYADHNPADAFSVKSVAITDVFCLGSIGMIAGQAEVSKLNLVPPVQVRFEIDVNDAGEPGSGVPCDTYHIHLVELGYDSGQVCLQGGNVQVTSES